MFAISNEGILIVNEVEPDMMNLVPIMEFVMTLEVVKLERTPLRDFLGLTNPKVLEYRDEDFKTFIGFHHLEEFSKTFAQIVTIERARRKAQQKYDRKQRMERLKFWKKKTNTSSK